ncbi:HPr Serine kinase C-terminal domain-containing protein [Devosia crocina]|uniref:HPr Serine kinase C-terminal domain-containing protein n=1 Tax=Devosia crocina TaxID=429728 RepID=A0A1I7NUH5_9HYPH|nr:hypothetical protein [Devosia crocina]SFV38304.1 HPr Serine kinase C-terminal domain-containing protein [Devosia crocina]
MSRHNIHATALLVDGAGVLLRGPSGSGKSLLALLLLDWWALRGRSAMLVADDRVDLTLRDDAIVLSTPELLAGLIELRGRGIVRKSHAPEARLMLVVDLVPDLERMPEDPDFRTEILGRPFARCPVPRLGVIGADHQRLLVDEALGAIAFR